MLLVTSQVCFILCLVLSCICWVGWCGFGNGHDISVWVCFGGCFFMWGPWFQVLLLWVVVLGLGLGVITCDLMAFDAVMGGVVL